MPESPSQRPPVPGPGPHPGAASPPQPQPPSSAQAPSPGRAASTPHGPRVVLVGPPGAGKTTVGRHLAGMLGVDVRDTDADVERTAGAKVADVFVTEGEAHFRRLERAAVETALAEHRGVLALGGGAVMDPLTEDSLTRYAHTGGTVVFLDVSLASAAPRVGLNQSRPLLLGNPRQQWLALMNERRGIYVRVATLVVDTDGRAPREVAAEIYEKVGQ